MTWNHRVIRTVYEHEILFGIHEVYYEDAIPYMVTVNPVGVVGETMEELKEEMQRFLIALTKPILEYSDFEEGGKYFTDLSVASNDESFIDIDAE